jgi:hypothetical protein
MNSYTMHEMVESIDAWIETLIVLSATTLATLALARWILNRIEVEHIKWVAQEAVCSVR